MQRYKKYYKEDNLCETCPESSNPKGGRCAKSDNSGYLKNVCDKGNIWDKDKETCIRMTKENRKRFREEINVKEVIQELIDTKWSGTNDEQVKAVELLKGLSTSDDPMANKFMKYLDDFTSKMNISDFEKMSEKKKGKRKC